jgi:hypothetical protein
METVCTLNECAEALGLTLSEAAWAERIGLAKYKKRFHNWRDYLTEERRSNNIGSLAREEMGGEGLV